MSIVVERVRQALAGLRPDRVPVVPKIWVDLAAALTGEALPRVIEDPAAALRVILDAGRLVGADAVRQFHFPARRTATLDGVVCEVDAGGRRIGPIDMLGGLATHVDDPRLLDLADPERVAFLQFWTLGRPLVETLADVRRIAVPTPDFYRHYGCADRQRAVMAQAGDDMALLGDCGSPTLAFCVLLRTMSQAMLDLVDEPALVHAMMEKGAEIAIERGRFNIELGLKTLRLNDSVANMSVISPAQWREFVLPHMKTVCAELHAADPDVLIYCHICGNILPIVEGLLAAGLDCIAPLDPLGGFTCAQMRSAVGSRASLMGGVNTLSFVRGTPETIEAEARACIEGAGPAGFILGSGCVIPRGAPRRNVAALRAAAERYGAGGS